MFTSPNFARLAHAKVLRHNVAGNAPGLLDVAGGLEAEAAFSRPASFFSSQTYQSYPSTPPFARVQRLDLQRHNKQFNNDVPCCFRAALAAGCAGSC